MFSLDGVTVEHDFGSSVHVLRMNRGENLFNPELVGLLNRVGSTLPTFARWVPVSKSLSVVCQALDAIEATREESAPLALVVTGTGKFFSNGLDLNWLAPRRCRRGACAGRGRGSIYKHGVRVRRRRRRVLGA